MRKYVLLTLSWGILLFAIPAHAQHKCATTNLWLKRVAQDPQAMERRARMEENIREWLIQNPEGERGGEMIITIPVVVHVLWHTAAQNISDEQIYSQIVALNEDFRLLNADQPEETHPFYDEAADTKFEFCLAQQDPYGEPTDGINRVYTNKTFWGEDELDDMKFTIYGGTDNWDPYTYLNIWVYESEDDFGTLGFATFPDELEDYPEYDGVAVRNGAFGYVGDLDYPNDLGRTGTHEVGHWLGLYHIWGDEYCGDDLVNDTPPAEEENYECPNYPHNANNGCGSDARGEMFMNYMDYVDDACMVMFTGGQASRMLASFVGYRSDILESDGCQPPSGAGVHDEPAGSQVSVYPNPVENELYVSALADGVYSIDLYDMSGKLVLNRSFALHSQVARLVLGELPSGIYTGIIRCEADNGVSHHKIVVR